jgi:Phosphotransferase enzyme family
MRSGRSNICWAARTTGTKREPAGLLNTINIATEVARKLGVPLSQPVIISEGMNEVVHLRPSPIVARVTRVAHMVRPVEVWAEGVAFGQALRERVVPPTTKVDPGPHVENGHYVTLWEYVDSVQAAPEEAGSSLRALHDAACTYKGKLRGFDPRPDALIIAELIGGGISTTLRQTVERIECRDLPEQPIHGDANLGNAITGRRWLDLDDVCIGPPEWDVACLRHRHAFFGELRQETREALGAYGSYDEAVVAALEPLVVLSIAAWGALAPFVGEKIGPRTLRRLQWLQERYGR